MAALLELCAQGATFGALTAVSGWKSTDMDYEVRVVAGQLVLLSKALAVERKNDVLNSLLFAQLYATSKVDKFCQAIAWDKQQGKALQEAGWMTLFSLARSSEPSSRQVVSLSKWLAADLAKVLESEHSLPALAAGNALSALECNPVAQKVFFDNVLTLKPGCSSSGVEPVSSVSLQVILVEPGALVACVHLGLAVRVTLDEGLLNQPFEGQSVIGAMSSFISRMELDEAKYNRVRSKIAKALGAQREALIVDVSVPALIVDPAD